MIIARGALGTILTAAFMTAGCSVWGACPPVAPTRLPDGSPPGTLARSVAGDAQVAIWRAGDDSFVIQRILASAASSAPHCAAGKIAAADGCHEPADFTVRGTPAVLVPVRSQDETNWAVAWSSGACQYETIFGRLHRAEAEAYAAGY
jgi:hypothetical protein